MISPRPRTVGPTSTGCYPCMGRVKRDARARPSSRRGPGAQLELGPIRLPRRDAELLAGAIGAWEGAPR